MATGLNNRTLMVSRAAVAALLWLLAAAASAQTVRYIHTDALGSVAVVTDQNRNVVERREYEPYGRQLTPAIKDGPGYTGHVQDSATGLTYMQQRYYDPICGCFLSVDPVTAYGSGDWRQFNRYAYAFNNPYRFTDPDGRTAFTWEDAGKLLGKRAATAGVSSAADGPLPVGEAIGIGILVYTVGEIGYRVYQSSGEEPNAEGAGERIKELVGDAPTTESVKGLAEKGWEWRGKPGEAVGSDKGAFVNPETGEQIHNDLDSHASGSDRGPHVTYTDGSGRRWDHFPETKTTVEQKK